jgi:hypothetical protein
MLPYVDLLIEGSVILSGKTNSLIGADPDEALCAPGVSQSSLLTRATSSRIRGRIIPEFRKPCPSVCHHLFYPGRDRFAGHWEMAGKSLS